MFRVPAPSNGMGPQGSPGSTPFRSICKLLAAFLRSSLVFANTYHPYNTNDSCHTYHTYHTYQTYHTFQTCHTGPTIHTIHIQHTIPQGVEEGGQYHTPTTPRGGRGTVLWLTYDHGQGGGGLQGWTYIYIYNIIYIWPPKNSWVKKHQKCHLS